MASIHRPASKEPHDVLDSIERVNIDAFRKKAAPAGVCEVPGKPVSAPGCRTEGRTHMLWSSQDELKLQVRDVNEESVPAGGFRG